MDIQNIDLRRGDFEGMHPKAKLFGFDEDKKLYTGDGVESINDQWTTWCACIGMLHLGGKEAQAVPEGFVLVKMDDLELLRGSALKIKYASLNNDSDRIFSDIEDIQLSIERLIELQEPAND